jgi:hypothetical protein
MRETAALTVNDVVPLLPPLNGAAGCCKFPDCFVDRCRILAGYGAAQVPDYVKTVVERTVLPK